MSFAMTLLKSRSGTLLHTRIYMYSTCVDLHVEMYSVLVLLICAEGAAVCVWQCCGV